MASPSSAPRPRRKRRIPIEHYDRVSLMLISMVPYPEIEKQLSMSWGKPRKYIRDIISQVHADWEEGAALVAHTRRNQIRLGMEALFLKATQKGDLQTAARVLTELGRLDGCYQAEKVQVTHQGQVGVGISLGSLGFKSSDEVRDRIEYLQKQLEAEGPKALTAGQAQQTAQAHLTGIQPDTHANGAPTGKVIDIPSDSDDEEGTS